MAVKSVTDSLGRGPSSMVQNRDQRDFSGNTENTPLLSVSSRVDLNIDQERNDETRNIENFEIGGFLAFRRSYDRQTRAHHYNLSHFFSELFLENCFANSLAAVCVCSL